MAPLRGRAGETPARERAAVDARDACAVPDRDLRPRVRREEPLDEAFRAQGLAPDIVLSAVDSDVIKTYVELGLGIGIIAAMAFDEKRDRHLRALDAGHLFVP